MKIKSVVHSFVIVVVFVILAISCKKDNDTNNPTPDGTVTDIEGNVYHTVIIGTQTWMVENLKTTKYRNGDAIPNITNGSAWSNLTTGAQCNYNNDSAIGNKYGKLYNWYALNDSRNIAPNGWHVASDAEWTTLENYVAANLGTSGSVAKALASKTDWASSTNGSAIGNDLTKNNTSGFTALPGGVRDYDGEFYRVSVDGFWWSPNESNVGDDWGRVMFSSTSTVYKNRDGIRECGFSVRCIKD